MTLAEWKDDFKGFVKSLEISRDDYKGIMEYIDDVPEPHWIPVEQAPPEENYLDDGYVEPSQPVLVYMSYHCYKVSRYWGHRKTKGTSGYVIPDWMDLEDHDGDNVLAWCELPEPYKGATE